MIDEYSTFILYRFNFMFADISISTTSFRTFGITRENDAPGVVVIQAEIDVV